MAIIGRQSIFRDKADGVRVQAIITKRGGQAFEWKRQELSALYLRIMGRSVESVSDADVVEYLARGEKDTRAYLEARKRAEG